MMVHFGYLLLARTSKVRTLLKQAGIAESFVRRDQWPLSAVTCAALLGRRGFNRGVCTCGPGLVAIRPCYMRRHSVAVIFILGGLEVHVPVYTTRVL